MKHFSTLLSLLLLFCCTIAVAQKNTVHLAASFLPVGDNPVAHGAVGYFRQVVGNQSIGLKAMVSSDGLGTNANRSVLTFNNMDLVYQWTISKNKRASQWNLEAGISKAWTVERIPPMQGYRICGTGLTEQELLEMQNYYEEVLSKPHVERTHLIGLASAASWQVALSKRVRVGAGTILNVYFSPENGWTLLPMPNLNMGYSF